MEKPKSIRTIYLLLIMIFFIAGCGAKKDTETQKPDTLEDAINKEVKDPIENTVKMHQMKDKLEERLNGYQDQHNQGVNEASDQ